MRSCDEAADDDEQLRCRGERGGDCAHRHDSEANSDWSSWSDQVGDSAVNRRASSQADDDLEETQAERNLVFDTYGDYATKVLSDIGFLDVQPVCAHGVWLSGEDREMLGQHGASKWQPRAVRGH